MTAPSHDFSYDGRGGLWGPPPPRDCSDWRGHQGFQTIISLWSISLKKSVQGPQHTFLRVHDNLPQFNVLFFLEREGATTTTDRVGIESCYKALWGTFNDRPPERGAGKG